MAITIYQYPNQLNQVNSDLIWVVSSSFTNAPQYQYICTLKDGCGNDLTTIKQQPNPSQKGVFDLGRIARQYIGFDTTMSMFNAGASNLYHKLVTSSRYFRVAFGEEYSTSLTGSVKVYNGINNTTPAAPAQSGSVPYYFWLNGVVNPNSGDWNWQSQPYYRPQVTPSNATFDFNVCLTEAPRTQYCQDYDYMTLSFINGNISGSGVTAQDIYYVEMSVYDATGSLIHQENQFNLSTTPPSVNSGGPRTASTQLWSSFPTVNPCFNTSSLLSVGMGPQNITNTTNFDMASSAWSYYVVKLYAQEATDTPNFNGVWDTFTIYRQEQPCGYERVRFAFVNNLGTWDYYNFTLAQSKTTTMDRSTYKNSFVDYSTSTTSVPYNRQRRGQTTYNIDLDEIYLVNSNWLNQEEADWLEQLFYSPNVYIQDGLTMIPIVIENAQVLSRTNPKSQKMFKHEITYRLANSLRSR